jgi:hypothetical protein
MNKPNPEEYNQFYGGYINLVPNGNIVTILKTQLDSTVDFLQNIPHEKWTYAYDSGKWTLAESWIHVLDTERIFAYRALRIARGDSTPLPGFEQDDYVPHSNAANRTPGAIIHEWETVRAATISLLESFSDEMFLNLGHASNSPVSTRALAFIMAGHVEHHIKITQEKYLS